MGSADNKKLIKFFSSLQGAEYVIFDRQNAILKISPKFKKAFNLKREAVLGRPLHAFLPHFSRDTAEGTEQKTTAANGDTVCIAYVELEDFNLLTIRPAQPERETDYLEEVFRTIKQGIIVCDSSGKIIYYNDAYGEIDGMKPDSVVGQRIEEAYALNRKSSLLFQTMETKSPMRAFRQQYTTSLGNRVDVVKDVYPLLKGEKVIGAFSIVRGLEDAKQWAKRIVQNSTDYQYGQDVLLKLPVSRIRYGKKMKALLQKLKIIAERNVHVALFGEFGTETDALVKYLVGIGKRAAQPFFMVDCAAVPANLIGKLLFGYVEDETRPNGIQPGFLKNANGGTVMLKNVEAIPSSAQSILQNYLTSGGFYPIGGLVKQYSDVQIITSFTSPLVDVLHGETVQPMLAYGLTTIALTVPPLRERPTDITTLAQWLLNLKPCSRAGAKRLTEETKRRLTEYAWPGNILELKNAMETAAVMSGENEDISPNHLPEYITERKKIEDAAPSSDGENSTLNETLAKTELRIITQALQANGGNISRTAERLGIKRQNLQYRMRKLGI